VSAHGWASLSLVTDAGATALGADDVGVVRRRLVEMLRAKTGALSLFEAHHTLRASAVGDGGLRLAVEDGRGAIVETLDLSARDVASWNERIQACDAALDEKPE
jgi:hypothetical protein